MTDHPYPAITKAALMMARSNGGINRFRNEHQFLKLFGKVLIHTPHDLTAIDKYLAGKSDDDLLLIVDGEQTQAEAMLHDAPPGTSMLLDDIFLDAV